MRLNAVKEKSAYPEEDLEIDEFFPKRAPGEFPAVSVRERVPEAAAVAVAVEEAAEYDPLRDGPLRYLGYANECGEAFAAWIPGWGVPLSYGVAIAYVLVDTADKGVKAYKDAEAELDVPTLNPAVDAGGLAKLLAVERTLDTVVWQMLASVIIPGYTIHTLVAAVHGGLVPLESTQGLLDFFESAAPALGSTPAALLALFDKTLPTLLGLGAIPFIVHPIDEGVHLLLNRTLRPAMKQYVCASGGGLAGLALCKDCETAEECEVSGRD